jgi:hypothetical protein
MVVADERLEESAEMAFVQDDDVVEQLSADGGDKALGDSILPRAPVAGAGRFHLQPWRRGAPQEFSVAILRMRYAGGRETRGGRPPRAWRRRMSQRLTRGVQMLLAAVLVTSCGGGSSPGGGGCERVSAGSSSVTIKNDLATGLEAGFPQFAFGADLASGECNIVGLEYSAASVDVRVELTQCNNSAADTNCTGRTFGPTRVQTIGLPRGGSRTVTVTAATFN